MPGIYTSWNPETGEPTQSHEFVNSWKREYNLKDYDSWQQQRDALNQSLRLHSNTPLETAEKFKQMKESLDWVKTHFHKEERLTQEQLEALESAAFHTKDLQKNLKTQQKNLRQFKEDIKPYLNHQPECLILKMKIVGRSTQKTNCTCGLNKLLKKKL
tara:strand:- start:230 stop:703 length:474 start_codon:yes stop_codon:yes gene_type:complete